MNSTGTDRHCDGHYRNSVILTVAYVIHTKQEGMAAGRHYVIRVNIQVSSKPWTEDP